MWKLTWKLKSDSQGCWHIMITSCVECKFLKKMRVNCDFFFFFQKKPTKNKTEKKLNMEFVFHRGNQFRIIISLKYTKINICPAPCFHHSLYHMDHRWTMFLVLETIYQSCQVTESFKSDWTDCFGFTFEIF